MNKKIKVSRAAQAMVRDDTLVLDAEMVSISQPDIISICIVSSKSREVLFDSLVSTDFELCPKAQNVHKITHDDLIGAPNFFEVWREIEDLRNGRKITSFMTSADFSAIEFSLTHSSQIEGSCFLDIEVSENPLLAYMVDPPEDIEKLAVNLHDDVKADCIQQMFCNMYGSNNSYRTASLKSAIQKLNIKVDGALHTARTDALAATDLLRCMADYESRLIQV